MGTMRTSPRPEQDRVRQAVEGGDFEAFFAAAWPRLYPVAVAVAGERGAAEDALQGAFAKAYSRWDRVCSADHPEAYVRRIVLNEVIGSRRYGFARRERASDRLPEAHRVGDSPETDVVRRDEVLAALRTLPPRQRAVVVLATTRTCRRPRSPGPSAAARAR